MIHLDGHLDDYATGDGQYLDPDGHLRRRFQSAAVGQRQKTDLVQSIRCIGDQLTQEDLPEQ